MFCTGCGNKISETEKFCKLCGTKNIYYIPDMQQGSAAEVIPTESMHREEPSSEAVSSGNRSDISEASVIQPEVVILPVDQMGQTRAAGENLKLEAGNVIVKPIEVTPVKVRKPAKEVGTGGKVSSVFLSILAFLLTMIFITSLFLKFTLSQSSLETSIQKVDYASMELGELLVDSNLDIEVREGDTTVDVVYEALTGQGGIDVSRSEVEEILEETTFKEYLSEKLSGYARYAVTGAEPDEITPREIARLVRDNRDKIEEITDLQITSKDLDELELYLEEDEVLESFSLEKIDQAMEEKNVDKLRTYFSDTILMVLIIVSLLLFIGTVVLVSSLHKKVKAPLIYIGIPVFTSGLIFTITFIILSIMKGRLFEEIKALYQSIKPFLTSILTRGIIIGATTAVIGLLMISGYVIIIKVKKREEARIRTAQ